MRVKASNQKQEIIPYLTDHVSATTSDLTELLEIKPTQLKTILHEMNVEASALRKGATAVIG